MEVSLEWVSVALSFLSVIVIPIAAVLFKKMQQMQIQYHHIIELIMNLQDQNNQYEYESGKNWLQFYNNEIIRFNERLKAKPEHIPTQEHYKSVFDNFERYKELGGNGYIDAIMSNIKSLYKIHHGFDYYQDE